VIATTAAIGRRARVSRQEFRKALLPVASMARQRARVPGIVYLETSAVPQTIRISGSDMRARPPAAIRTACAAEVDQPWGMSVPAKPLLALVESMTGNVLDLVADLKHLTLALQGEGEDHIVYGSDEQAVWSAEEAIPFFAIKRSDLQELVDVTTPMRAHPMLAQSEVKPWLSGISLTVDEQVKALATDGVRIGRCVRPAEICERGSVILDPGPLRTAVSLAAPGEWLYVDRVGDNIQVRGHGFEVRLTPVIGVYPDIERFLPAACPDVITLDREALLRAIRLVCRLAPLQAAFVLERHDQSVVIGATIPEQFECRKVLPATVQGERYPMAFNAALLAPALRTLSGAEVQIHSSGPRSPVRLNSPQEPHITYVVLPLWDSYSGGRQ
jgi:hypothetical protein